MDELKTKIKEEFTYYMQDRGDLPVGYVFTHIADFFLPKLDEAYQKGRAEVMEALKGTGKYENIQHRIRTGNSNTIF